MRAWYLPTCVNRGAADVQSPIAHTFFAARMRSSTSMPPRPIVRPSSSRPMSCAIGRRPVATSRRSASTVEPSDSRRRTPGSTPSTATSSRTSMPSERKTSAISSPASACTRPSNRGPCSITVTFDPMRAKNCASSAPTGPPPITARLARTSCARVASWFTAGSEPVATTSRSYGTSVPSTSTTPARATPPRPRTNAQRWPSSHSSWSASSQSLVTQSRQLQTPAGSTRSGSRPGARSSDDASSAARSIVFVGIHAK